MGPPSWPEAKRRRLLSGAAGPERPELRFSGPQPEPQRSQSVVRPTCGLTMVSARAGSSRPVPAGRARKAGAAPAAPLAARAWCGLRGELERAAAPTGPPPATPPRPPARPTPRPSRAGDCRLGLPPSRPSRRFPASSGSARPGLSAAPRPPVTTASVSAFFILFYSEGGSGGASERSKFGRS